MNGVINILKPPMMNSSAVVAAVKRITGSAHVGHTGTLDPNAAGVLPIVIGRYTKLAEYFLADEKEYIGEILFGVETDSCDTEGNVTNTSSNIPTDDEILAALPQFCGDIVQYPPTYSAIRINGKKAYELARENKEVNIPPRDVHVDEIRLLHRTAPNRVTVSVKCSKGTYIRSLARDIGRATGSAACLSVLVRTKCGNFPIEEAVTLEQLESAQRQGTERELFTDPNKALCYIPEIVLPKHMEKRILCGNYIPTKWLDSMPKCDNTENLFRITVEGELLCLARLDTAPDGESIIQPTKVIAE